MLEKILKTLKAIGNAYKHSYSDGYDDGYCNGHNIGHLEGCSGVIKDD